MKKKIIMYFLALATVVLSAGLAQAQPKFTAALNSDQVVPPTNSTGRASCTVTLTNNIVTNLTCEYSGLSKNLHSARVGGGGGICGATVQGGTSGSFSLPCRPPYGPGPPNLSSLLQKRVSVTFYSYPPLIPEIKGKLKVVTLDSDVDGDGLMDAFLYRPFDACSYTLCSVDGDMMEHQFEGNPEDSTPFLADFDGDGLADHSFIRTNPYTNEITTIYVQSIDNAVRQVQWGNAAFGDQSANADYDRDGKIDIAVFRPAEGVWYILQSSDEQPRYEYWGTKEDRACPGDYDKDGKADLCVVRDENGQLTWYIQRSSDNQFDAVNWGLSTDKIFTDTPVDVDADGANDILVSRDEKGQRVFYALRSSDNSMFVLPWGLSSDGIRIGDFDGDGKTDFGALRDTDKQMVWLVWGSSDEQMRVFYWGLQGDL